MSISSDTHPTSLTESIFSTIRKTEAEIQRHFDEGNLMGRSVIILTDLTAKVATLYLVKYALFEMALRIAYFVFKIATEEGDFEAENYQAQTEAFAGNFLIMAQMGRHILSWPTSLSPKFVEACSQYNQMLSAALISNRSVAPSDDLQVSTMEGLHIVLWLRTAYYPFLNSILRCLPTLDRATWGQRFTQALNLANDNLSHALRGEATVQNSPTAQLTSSFLSSLVNLVQVRSAGGWSHEIAEAYKIVRESKNQPWMTEDIVEGIEDHTNFHAICNLAVFSRLQLLAKGPQVIDNPNEDDKLAATFRELKLTAIQKKYLLQRLISTEEIPNLAMETEQRQREEETPKELLLKVDSLTINDQEHLFYNLIGLDTSVKPDSDRLVASILRESSSLPVRKKRLLALEMAKSPIPHPKSKAGQLFEQFQKRCHSFTKEELTELISALSDEKKSDSQTVQAYLDALPPLSGEQKKGLAAELESTKRSEDIRPMTHSRACEFSQFEWEEVISFFTKGSEATSEPVRAFIKTLPPLSPTEKGLLGKHLKETAVPTSSWRIGEFLINLQKAAASFSQVESERLYEGNGAGNDLPPLSSDESELLAALINPEFRKLLDETASKGTFLLSNKDFLKQVGANQSARQNR